MTINEIAIFCIIGYVIGVWLWLIWMVNNDRGKYKHGEGQI